ncbi:MAG TPA: type IIL restriction-modification enzyme MmeI [Candidatus Binataceae bacterium]|nr:type IIL restriction-modification enzyme MmeI [Candidatus Binataceae bacterium]
MKLIFSNVSGAGVLDYVCAWYVKAGDYVKGTRIKVAFVSTNSITQGEQVGILWDELFKRFHLEIHFAHRTFAWQSEARGNAHVHVVIIGFSSFAAASRTLFDYHDLKGEPVAFPAKNINPYLADAPDTLILKRGSQVSSGPAISYGSMANDRRKTDKGLGNLILDAESRARLLTESLAIAPCIRRFVGSEEFLNGTQRWCLWLVDAEPAILRASPSVRRRIDAVREARLDSGRAETRRLAATPQLFGEIRQPDTPYLLIPKVSSETRPYMPVGFMSPSVIANGSALIIPEATLYHLGVLASRMHMAWMRQVCGRMKSDYQYSSQIVYNNYPWPEAPSDGLRAAVEAAAQAVLDTRKAFPGATLADLYDPLAMPPALVKAHAELDRAVERCYRSQPFDSDRHRVEYLFGLYEKLTAPLMAPNRKGCRKVRKQTRGKPELRDEKLPSAK